MEKITSRLSRCAGVPLNTNVGEISVTSDISALGVSVLTGTEKTLTPKPSVCAEGP
jgi:hypothetical protein